jgi:hypothetical protein
MKKINILEDGTFDIEGGESVETFIATHRNHKGEIINFVTSEGRVISYRKALIDVENGLIDGIQMVEDGKGNTYLIPDNNNSFDDLPDLF